jgi:hypothetical protein
VHILSGFLPGPSKWAGSPCRNRGPLNQGAEWRHWRQPRRLQLGNDGGDEVQWGGPLGHDGGVVIRFWGSGRKDAHHRELSMVAMLGWRVSTMATWIDGRCAQRLG